MASAVTVPVSAPRARIDPLAPAAALPSGVLRPLADAFMAGCLADQPRLVERLFDCARDTLFFVKDRSAHYVAVNQALVARCGAASKAELIGRTVLDLFPEPMGSAYYAQDRHVLDTGAEIRDHLQLTPRDGGRWGWSLSYKFPLADPDGGIIGLCGICKDVGALPAIAPELSDEHPSSPLERAVDYIQHHYPECVRIEQLARLTGLTARQLERLIKRRYHLTPVQLLARTRIEAAMQQLAQGGESVAKIASACGYSDQSAFTRQFKAAVGMTPTRYRSVSRGEEASIAL